MPYRLIHRYRVLRRPPSRRPARSALTPAAVAKLSAERDPADRRKVTLTWTPADGATAYLIRYGIAPEKLYQHDLVSDGGKTELTLYNLNGKPPYHFRIDAMNASGRTTSAASAHVP